MNEKSTIARYSLSQVKAMRDRGEDKTSPNAPEAESLGTDFWKNARANCMATQWKDLNHKASPETRERVQREALAEYAELERIGEGEIGVWQRFVTKWAI
jgi:hypothetical protein